MEANTWTLVIVGGIVLTLLVLILLKNHRDKREYYESMNASEDLTTETGNEPDEEK